VRIQLHTAEQQELLADDLPCAQVVSMPQALPVAPNGPAQ
jgi:hypothetical protein